MTIAVIARAMAPPVIARAVGPKQSPPLSRKSGRSIQGGIPMPLSSNQVAALRTLSSPTVANAIETFKVRPREAGNLSSEIRALFPDLSPVVGYAATALIRAEHPAAEGKRASIFAWWDYIQTIPAPRIIVMHDLDHPRGQGAFWGEVQANIHKALGCAGVVTDGSCGTWTRSADWVFSSTPRTSRCHTRTSTWSTSESR